MKYKKKIAVYNLEPHFINIALEKIRIYYENKGYEVDNYKQLWHNQYEKIFCSSIFDFSVVAYNKDHCITSDMICGGTGFFCLDNKEKKKLPEGLLIKNKQPDDIFNIKVRCSFGRTSAGCIRNCYFCIVPKTWGKPKVLGDIYDVWDGRTDHLILIDDNILALPDHFKDVCRDIKKEGLKVDFNQGLDIRLLNDDQADLLKSIKHFEYKFAWDGKEDLESRFRKLKKQLGRCMVYVYCNGNWDWEMEKIMILKSIDHDPYVMRDSKLKPKRGEQNSEEINKYTYLSRWVNQKAMFKTKTFEEFKKM